MHKFAHADAKRALLRGLGAASKAAPLPLEKLADNDNKAAIDSRRSASWPAAGISAAVAASAWLLREMESSSAFLRHAPQFPKSEETMGPC